MEDRHFLATLVFCWVAILVFCVWQQRRSRMPTAGLGFVYIFSLSMLHLSGAFVYTLPWYTPQHPVLVQIGHSLHFTALGFHQSLYGLVGFGIGSLCFAPLVYKFFFSLTFDKTLVLLDARLPVRYFCIGLFLYICVKPLVSSIPSVGLLAFLGSYLIIAAICLGCWKAWYFQKKKELFQWLAISLLLPVITVSQWGFLGFGAMAFLIVFIFVFYFYRPRWQAHIALLILIFFGFSLYVNYMRDRTNIRDRVWGGSPFSEVMGTFWETAQNFEFLDLYKQEHLEAIDGRLNQNLLVGRAIEYLDRGNVDYAYGETVWQSFLAIIPRAIWHDKPVYAGSPGLVAQYTGMRFPEGTSVGVGPVMEFYINWGTWGVIFGFIIVGLLVGIIDFKAGSHLQQGAWKSFLTWFVPGLGFLHTNGSLVELTSTVAALYVLITLVNKVSRTRN
jgi:hypothetical protein